MSQLKEVLEGNLPIEMVNMHTLHHWETVFLSDMQKSNGFIVEENGEKVHYSFHPEEERRNANGHNGRLFIIKLRCPYENMGDEAIIHSNNVWRQGEIDAEWLWLFEDYGTSEFLPVSFKERIRQESAAFAASM